MAAACTNGLDTGFVSLGYAKVSFLGVVQGITELMPISSTAHMRLVPWALGWLDPGSAFSATMQLAALFAVVSYFWSDVRDIVFGSLSAAVRGDFRDRNLRPFRRSGNPASSEPASLHVTGPSRVSIRPGSQDSG